jgi:hypothetical protein
VIISGSPTDDPSTSPGTSQPPTSQPATSPPATGLLPPNLLPCLLDPLTAPLKDVLGLGDLLGPCQTPTSSSAGAP